MDQVNITIQGYEFAATPRYAAGHILKENEAKALNQTLMENYRNNFASTVRAKIKEVLGDTPDENATLPDHVLEELQAEFNDYADKYEFAVRSVGGATTPRDPVLAEALKIALGAIKDSIRAQGGSPKDYDKEALDTAARQLVADDPEYMETARDIVSRRQALAAKTINLPVKSAA